MRTSQEKRNIFARCTQKVAAALANKRADFGPGLSPLMPWRRDKGKVREILGFRQSELTCKGTTSTG